VVSCFFFSSRRRHTRSKRDWSSDVCSSDLRDLILFQYGFVKSYKLLLYSPNLIKINFSKELITLSITNPKSPIKKIADNTSYKFNILRASTIKNPSPEEAPVNSPETKKIQL